MAKGKNSGHLEAGREDGDTGSSGKSKATVCPISKEQFRKNARSMAIQIGESQVMAAVKEFATGSLGWYVNAKIPVVIDGVECQVQVGANLTIVGSKKM